MTTKNENPNSLFGDTSDNTTRIEPGFSAVDAVLSTAKISPLPKEILDFIHAKVDTVNTFFAAMDALKKQYDSIIKPLADEYNKNWQNQSSDPYIIAFHHKVKFEFDFSSLVSSSFEQVSRFLKNEYAFSVSDSDLKEHYETLEPPYVSKYGYKKIKLPISVDSVIKTVEDLLGNRSLSDVVEDQLDVEVKAFFKIDTGYYVRRSGSIDNTLLILNSFYRETWEPEIRMNLARAVSKMKHNSYSHTEYIEHSGIITKYQGFKNGNLKITFSTREFAEQFWCMFCNPILPSDDSK